MNDIRIGLDIDGVLANFAQAFIERAKAMGVGEHFPAHWTLWDRWMYGGEHFSVVWEAITHDHSFWLDDIKSFDDAYVHFDVQGYITHRPVPTEVSRAWLNRHGFPDAPVITVTGKGSKVQAARDLGIDVFVDDKYDNFVELNDAGILCLLYDRPHNRREDAARYVYDEQGHVVDIFEGRARSMVDAPVVAQTAYSRVNRISV